jgi:hypothetical protein
MGAHEQASRLHRILAATRWGGGVATGEFGRGDLQRNLASPATCSPLAAHLSCYHEIACPLGDRRCGGVDHRLRDLGYH